MTKNQVRQKYEVAKLSDPGVALNFREEINKVLEERPARDNDIEEEWNQLKEGIQMVAGNVIGIQGKREKKMV